MKYFGVRDDITVGLDELDEPLADITQLWQVTFLVEHIHLGERLLEIGDVVLEVVYIHSHPVQTERIDDVLPVFLEVSAVIVLRCLDVVTGERKQLVGKAVEVNVTEMRFKRSFDEYLRQRPVVIRHELVRNVLEVGECLRLSELRLFLVRQVLTLLPCVLVGVKHHLVRQPLRDWVCLAPPLDLEGHDTESDMLTLHVRLSLSLVKRLLDECVHQFVESSTPVSGFTLERHPIDFVDEVGVHLVAPFINRHTWVLRGEILVVGLFSVKVRLETVKKRGVGGVMLTLCRLIVHCCWPPR